MAAGGWRPTPRRRVCAANDLGILSEEFWVKDGQRLGNFPQALSHVALANTAMTIASGGKPPRLNAA
jgi:Glycosyl hydrolases family 15